MRSLIVLSLLIVTVYSAKKTSNTCYTTENVCVPTKPPSTGLLWKDCQEYCDKCKGRTEGKCEKMDQRDCKGYRCRCSGEEKDRTDVLKESATCRLGL